MLPNTFPPRGPFPSSALTLPQARMLHTVQQARERMQSALTERHFVIGLAKAPVFALFIAVACAARHHGKSMHST